MIDSILQSQYFSDFCHIEKSKLDELGIFNPILNHDTKVFVDPFLVKNTKSYAFQNAYQDFKEFFAKFLKCIALSREEADIAWKQAQKMLNDNMHEYRFTCIGYGTTNTQGKGSGKKLNQDIIVRAKTISDYDKNDPEIFSLLPLFEKDIGGDRISDMTQNILDHAICEYTAWAMQELNIQGNKHYFDRLHNKSYHFILNPFSKLPIKLLPKDILTDSPLADNIHNAIYEITQINESLRHKTNDIIGGVWRDYNKKEAMQKIWDCILKDNQLLVDFLKELKSYPYEPYNLSEDWKGLHRWLLDAYKFNSEEIEQNKLDFKGIDCLNDFIHNLITSFKQQIEDGLWTLFWTKYERQYHHVRQEYSQKLFFCLSGIFTTNFIQGINVSKDDNDSLKSYVFSKNNERLWVSIYHAHNHNLKNYYEKMLEKIQENNQNRYVMIVINFKDEVTKPLKDLKIIQNPKCPIYIINIPQPNDTSEITYYENLNVELDNLKKAQKKGGNSRHKTTNDIKEFVITPMFKVIYETEKYKKYENIGNSISNELTKLIDAKKEQLEIFMQQYQITHKDILIDAIKYNEEKAGGQINEWCRQLMSKR